MNRPNHQCQHHVDYVLISAGADLNLQDSDGDTPLELADMFGRSDTTAAIISASTL